MDNLVCAALIACVVYLAIKWGVPMSKTTVRDSVVASPSVERDPKYTPGPWHNAGGDVRDEHDREVAVVCSARNWEPKCGPIPVDEIVATGNLIAAAPELLEALKEVVALSDRKHNAWDKAHAVIAKAEGRA